MTIDRRAFLRSSAAGLAVLGAGLGTGCAPTGLPHPGAGPRSAAEGPFRHGVASGDPLSDRVMLWTRVSPEADRMGAALEVAWWVARDPEGRDVVARGRATASPDRDFTVKIDAAGLAPASTWYYGFVCEGFASAVGRTKTLPVADADRLRLALVSCANYPQGFFNAYACLAGRDDLDVVVHLGDYLYESGDKQYGDGAALGRVPDPVHEILGLEDYRRRHACYKADPDLQAAHRQHAWITIWDDHESANDAWRDGAKNHSPDEGDWSARKLAAIRAYFEWMPIRELPTGLFRQFRFGGLADLVMLDGRLHGRDQRIEANDLAAARAEDRSLLGADQTRWLLDALSASKAAGTRWRLIGQPVVFATLQDAEGRFNPDSWDGFRANRARILAHLREQGIDDVVVLTGDVHSAWAIDVPESERPGATYDPTTGRGSRAIEIVAPAVSSLPLLAHAGAREAFPDPEKTHPHVRFAELEHNGFVILDLNAERARAEFHVSAPVSRRSAVCEQGAVLEARTGSNHLVRLDERALD